jgi:hypothetical protein
MKRLLLGPVIIAALLLSGYLLSRHLEHQVPAVVHAIPLDDFKQFPPPPVNFTVPTSPVVAMHKLATKAKLKPHQVKPHGPLVLPPVPPAPPADVEREPDPPVQQYGRICIFPFGMIPHCTPGASE